MTVVRDAAAVVAVLLREPGGAVVLPVQRRRVTSAITASECRQRAMERGAAAAAIGAAALRPATRPVRASSGDGARLAPARSRGRSRLTGDRRLAGPDLGIPVRLIR
jgi:PIN domain nuclease of toxin-antitoxin system